MREDLELRGLRPNTIDPYLRCARRFVEHFALPPARLGAAEVRRYLLHLLHEAKVTPPTVNTYAAALRFLFRVTLKRPEVVADVVRLKTPMHLPRVLSGTEVERLFAAIPTLKHRAIVMLAYGASLRVSEVARLEVGDIDAKRMVLHIRDAKRGRERYVMLSPRLLSALRVYWKDARSRGLRLFPGRDPSKPITRAAIHRALSMLDSRQTPCRGWMGVLDARGVGRAHRQLPAPRGSLSGPLSEGSNGAGPDAPRGAPVDRSAKASVVS